MRAPYGEPSWADSHHEINAGVCVAWRLPMEEMGAALARRQVREVFRALRMPEEQVYDSGVVVSELVANVYTHALTASAATSPPVPPELHLYRRLIRPAIVVKVFDNAPWRGPFPPGPLRPAFEAENGRGLQIVDGLIRQHGGRWGVHRTRSRLAPVPVAGKAAYFALPRTDPTGSTAPLRHDCVPAARELQDALACRGLTRTHRCEAGDMAVLSVRPEITVWARQGAFRVTMPAVGTVRYPFDDLTDLVEAIVTCHEDLNARQSPHPPDGKHQAPPAAAPLRRLP